MHEILKKPTVWNHFHKISSLLLKCWLSQHLYPWLTGDWDSTATIPSGPIKHICVASSLLCDQPGGSKWGFRLTWYLIHAFYNLIDITAFMVFSRNQLFPIQCYRFFFFFIKTQGTAKESETKCFISNKIKF